MRAMQRSNSSLRSCSTASAPDGPWLAGQRERPGKRLRPDPEVQRLHDIAAPADAAVEVDLEWVVRSQRFADCHQGVERSPRPVELASAVVAPWGTSQEVSAPLDRIPIFGKPGVPGIRRCMGIDLMSYRLHFSIDGPPLNAVHASADGGLWSAASSGGFSAIFLPWDF